jgi:hypothetical protein
MENIVGIRYIGSKPTKTDNVAGTGAVWKPKEVINFSSSLAALLLVHAGVFALTDVNPKGATYMGNGKKVGGKQEEPVAFANISGMEAKELDAYARLNFNRGIDLKADIKESRKIVMGWMSNATLDEEADRLKAAAANKLSITLEVTDLEYEAYQAGTLALKLVPVVVNEPQGAGGLGDAGGVSGSVTGNTAPPLGAPNAGDAAPTTGGEALTAANTDEKPAEATATTDVQPTPSEELQTLPELLAKLDKKGLMTLGKENGVKVANTMSVEVLREKILAALGEKA